MTLMLCCIMLYLNVSVLILRIVMIILCFEKLLADDNLMMISNTILTVSKQWISKKLKYPCFQSVLNWRHGCFVDEAMSRYAQAQDQDQETGGCHLPLFAGLAHIFGTKPQFGEKTSLVPVEKNEAWSDQRSLILFASICHDDLLIMLQ